jgi:hypothetical protein
MEGHFIKRGFNKKLVIKDQFSEVKVKDRAEMLRQTDKRKNSSLGNRVPLVVEFHPPLKEINGIVEALWPILETSERMRDVFGSRPIVSYIRDQNI